LRAPMWWTVDRNLAIDKRQWFSSSTTIDRSAAW